MGKDMTTGVAMIPLRQIRRRDLPALERAGAIAQIVVGPEIVVVAFHPTRVDVETVSGIAIDVPSEIRHARARATDTVVLGSVGLNVVAMLDALMVGGKTQRGLPWRERLDVLRRVHDSLPGDVRSLFPPATVVTRRFLGSYDMVKVTGGSGLLVRVDGEDYALWAR